MDRQGLRELMAEARTLGLTCVDLAAHPLVAPGWTYCTVSDYLLPAWKGHGPSRAFRHFAAQALRALIAQAKAREGAAAKKGAAA